MADAARGLRRSSPDGAACSGTSRTTTRSSRVSWFIVPGSGSSRVHGGRGAVDPKVVALAVTHMRRS